MKVKNLVFSCIIVGLAALILGLFAEAYPMLSNLALLPEMIRHPDAWPYAVFILVFLLIVVFTGLILIFSAVGIFCDCGLIKSEKASKTMKIVSLVLSCFVLLFILGSLVVVGLVLQYLINAVLAIALLVMTILVHFGNGGSCNCRDVMRLWGYQVTKSCKMFKTHRNGSWMPRLCIYNDFIDRSRS